MARPVKKTVYERINDKKDEILKTEQTLKRLQSELTELNNEKDRLEMQLLLAKMKENNLAIEEALKLLNK